MQTTQTTNDAKRDALIAHIRKLQKFTTQAGCTEAEALAATHKVAALIAEHTVTQDELSLRADALHCIIDEFIEINGTKGDWTTCCVIIARIFGTKCWSQAREEDTLGLGFESRVLAVRYFGLGTDVAASVALTALIHTALHSEADRFRGDRKSFRIGMVMRLNERLRDMIPRQRTASGSNALMVLKDQLVTEEFAKQNFRLRKSRGTHMVPLNGAAFAAGRAAGDRVGLSRNVAAPLARIAGAR